MKILLLIIAFLVAVPGIAAAESACLSGDCDNGYGVHIEDDGTRYEGFFVNGEPRGYGVMTSPEFSMEGIFTADGLDGFGKVIQHRTGAGYEGDFENGKPHGKGVRTDADGNSYEGDFVEGKEHGYGVTTMADGGQYEGDFLNGEPLNGVLTFPNGSKVQIEDGKAVKKTLARWFRNKN